jgi:hypothetical protein
VARLWAVAKAGHDGDVVREGILHRLAASCGRWDSVGGHDRHGTVVRYGLPLSHGLRRNTRTKKVRLDSR